MKKITLLIVSLLCALSTMAIPAKDGIIEVKQPDGTILSVMQYGDENWNCATTPDGYLIKQDIDGYYVYAEMVNGRQIPTTTRVSQPALRSNEEIALTQKIGKFSLSNQTITAIRQERAMARMPMVQQRAGVVNTNAKRILVILISFKDSKFSKDPQEFYDLLNQENYTKNGSTGSVRDYFVDASNGQYTPQFDVYGPYTLDREMSYYGENDAKGNDLHADQMIVDACAKLDADKTANVNFRDYDTNNDGYVDNVFVFYAGHNAAESGISNAVWPHRWVVYDELTEGSIVFDGVELNDYACASELKGSYGSEMASIGPCCHEFSHVLGLVDFYVTDYSSNHKTCGMWDVMDRGLYNNDSKTPPTLSAHERFYLGWLTPTILNSPQDCELEELSKSNTAYLISMTGTHNLKGDNPNPKEYYLLENRQYTKWDEYLPGHGMLITKTKYDKDKWWNNTANNSASSMGYDIIEAKSGGYTEGDPSDTYPGIYNITSYTPSSQYPITEIAENNKVITFKFMGGTPAYTVTFDGREIGTPANDSITENSPREGLTLPNVTIDGNSEYTFEGWCTKMDADETDAGKAGDTFFPINNCTLYAVYSINGEIVPDEKVDCLIETFDNFTASSTTDISGSLDDYTDNKGWKGSKVYSFGGMAKIGTNATKGYITTPTIDLEGDITITLVGYAKEESTITATASKNSKTASESISTEKDTIKLRIYDFRSGSTIKLHTDSKIFYIDYMEICRTNTTATPTVTDNSNLILTNDGLVSTIHNLPENSTVNCFDITGRLLWSKVAESSEMQFTTPNSLYLIQVISENYQTTLKGINF